MKSAKEFVEELPRKIWDMGDLNLIAEKIVEVRDKLWRQDMEASLYALKNSMSWVITHQTAGNEKLGLYLSKYVGEIDKIRHKIEDIEKGVRS